MTVNHTPNRLIAMAWAVLERAAMFAFWAIITLTAWFLAVWIGFAVWEAVR